MKTPFLIVFLLHILKLGAQPADSSNLSTRSMQFSNMYSDVFEHLNIGNASMFKHQKMFRLAHEGKIVELRSYDGLEYRLVQYFFAWKCAESPGGYEKLFVDSIVYDSALSSLFYEKYVRDQRLTTWTADSSHRMINDGTVYCIDIKDSNAYYHRYYQPGNLLEYIDSQYLQHPEKIILEIFEKLNTNTEYAHFIEKNRLTCYTNGGYGVHASVPAPRKRKRLFSR